jgi:hypothetical protein
MRHHLARAGKAGWQLVSSLTSRGPAQGRPAAPKPALESLESRDLLSGFAYPNYILLNGDRGAQPLGSPGPTGISPSRVRHAYGFDQIFFNNGTVPGDGTGTTIAIVDAFDDPSAAGDLHQFDVTFGLPDPVFTKLNQNGGTTPPAANSGWALEIALDVEWAHAIAPKANILLVEANTNSNVDLNTAVKFAANYPGVVAVSMSWGGGESSGEAGSDSVYTTPSGHPGVTFLASSGDSGAPPIYPSISPNVVSVGGTTLSVDSAGNYISESGWGGSGGGISAFEPQPAYQKGVVTQSSTKRTSPDVAYDSNPSTGFPVYASYVEGTSTPWVQVGGTSDAAPQWAGLIAIADQGRALFGVGPLDGPSQTLPKLYAMPASNFHDITTGGSTGNPAYNCGPGYDLVTGLGTPIANLVVANLVDVVILSAVPDQTVPLGSSLNVSLSATDSNGLPITYGGVSQNLPYFLKQQYGWFFSGNNYFNYGGKSEKWFQGAGGAWFFVLPSGAVYKWDGTINQATGTLIATFDASYYADPSKLYNAQPSSPADIFVSGNVLTITPKAGFLGTFVVTATATDGFASDSKSFKVTVTTTNTPPTLDSLSDASISKGSSYTVTLHATDPDGDPITYGATAFSQAYQLKQSYGWFFGGNDYFNWGGKQEKWFQGAGGAWFFILPSGALYKWDGSGQATGTLIATMQTAYYADTSLLYNATPGVTVSLNGNVLTVTPDATFVGLITVTATASDGFSTDSKSFTLTVS